MKFFFLSNFSLIFALLFIVSWVHADNDNEVQKTCKPPEEYWIKASVKCVINKNEFALLGKTIELSHAYSRATCLYWYKDGNWISFIDDRLLVTGNGGSLLINNLNFEDSGVYTCVTGVDIRTHELYSINLEVHSPPYFTYKPEDIMIVNGASTELRCQAKSLPKATIKWLKDGKELRDRNYEMLETGDLLIRDAYLLVSGDYTCFASNEHGTVKTSATIIVHKPTKITEAPQNHVLDAGHTATFRCKVLAYKYAGARIDWLRNGQPIDVVSEPRVFLSDEGSVITIIKVRKADAGTYTCVASTDIDEVRAEAYLVVYDVPNKPTLIGVDCGQKEARVSWNATSDGRWPITHYTVEYNTSSTPGTWEIAKDHISVRDQSSIVKLSPWVNYTFRVIAWNKMGASEPSLHSSVCTTLPDVPYKNPDNLKVKYEHLPYPQFSIKWTVMPQIEHNAPNFTYRIYYKRDLPGENWTVKDIDYFRPNWYEVKTENKWQRYKIKIAAANEIGECNEAPREIVAFSGIEVPLFKAPGNFTVEKVISGTTALLSWTTCSDEELRGELSYKIETWTKKESEPRIFSIKTNETSTLFDKLIPQRENFITISAQSIIYTGPASNVISVFTPEEDTAAVVNLEAHPINFTTMMLKWEKPTAIKGILLGYKITCKKVNGAETDAEIAKFLQEDQKTMTTEISGLSLKTKYRFTVRATTTAGEGPTSFVEKISSRRPIKPTFKWQKISEENKFVDIKIIRDVTDDDYYFNSSFFVEYRMDGSETRKKTRFQTESQEIIVPSLEIGHTYVVYVVAFDQGYFVESDPQEINV